MKKVVVFGAGIAGLAAANKLARSGFDVKVYEKGNKLGGLSATVRDGDYHYDRGPHYFFSTLAQSIGIEDKCFRVHYYESIKYQGSKYSFPFGLARNPKFLISVGFSFLKRAVNPKNNYKDLHELLCSNYGESFSKKVLIPLIEKWAGYSAKELSSDFGKRLLPGNLRYLIYSLIKKMRGYTEDYYQKGRYIVYPKGGMKILFEKLASQSNLKIFLNTPVMNLVSSDNAILTAKTENEEIKADYYVSTIPLNELESCFERKDSVDKFYKDVKYRGVILLYLKFKKRKILEELWTWYPEKEYPFYRISEQIEDIYPKDSKNDKCTIVFEFGAMPNDQLWNKKDEHIKDIALNFLKNEYRLKDEEFYGFSVEREKYAYPILLKKYENEQNKMNNESPYKNLFLAGRTGTFNYYMLEESYQSGIKAADIIITSK